MLYICQHCVLVLVANRSISGLKHKCSIASIQYQHDLIYAAKRLFSRIIAYSQILRTWWWHSIERDVSILLMQWIAVVLSDMILMCLWLLFTNDFRASKIAFCFKDINMYQLLIWKPCPTFGHVTHGGSTTFKWSICVNSDANFRISYRFKRFEYILFPPRYFIQRILRQFYYCIEITFIIFGRL